MPTLPFGAEIERAAPLLDRDSPEWLRAVRRAGRAGYAALGWPHARTEAWKYTRLNALAGAGFAIAAPPAGDGADRAGAGLLDRPFDRAAPVEGLRIVLVNGRLRPDLSDPVPEGSGLSVTPLAGFTPDDDAGDAAAGLAGNGFDGLPLAALSAAMTSGGAVLRIAAGARLERVLHLVFIAMPGGDGDPAPPAFAPHCLILAGRDSRADIVESHVGDPLASGGAYFANLLTRVRLAPGAALGHYKWQDESRSAFHLATGLVRLGAGASYDNFVLSAGARLARNEIHGRLDGRGIDYRVNGAWLATDGQHLDTTTVIDHAAPDCHSREVYKGVVDGDGRGVFQGRILVRPGAQKTDGYQMNRALLLSPRAEMDSKPELEIYADDVRCSHGATVGELDEDALFYLRARGIAETRARMMLIEAWLADSLEEIRAAPVRAAFATLARARLARHLGQGAGP